MVLLTRFKISPPLFRYDYATFSLDILPRKPMYFKDEPIDKTVSVGQEVIMRCSADGFPAPTIEWKHNIENTEITDTSDLKITRAKESDTGDITCIAKNKLGEKSTTAKLTVVSKTTIIRGPSSLNDVDKQLGQSVLLPCDVVYDKTRGDTLTVDWTKKRTAIKLDVTLPDGQLKFVKNDDNSLTINDLTFEDEGEDEKWG